MEKSLNSTYSPSPIDVSEVELPESLTELRESLARNVHDVWAESRIREGWRFGETKNETLKTHPCLVPYEELPESEKEYDRNTAINTLKLVCKLGYKIEKL